ncbi:Ldh family oxidoreductase [Marinibacterium sp. SX1]|uniref:Ldh family oxidoreductase n=1 Tax=Marinibacterium sp. SX1 TaxID=3388424 RepID=UPI003D16E30E
MADTVTLSLDRAGALAAAAFRAAGVAGPMADDAGRALALAEAMGIPTHGLARVDGYRKRLAAGGMNPAARITTRVAAPGLVRVNGEDGLGPAVATAALRAAMEAARTTGLAAAFCHRSTHFAAAAPYCLTAAEAGFASIILSSAAPSVAPPGGLAPRFGTNPMAFGMPGPAGRHVIFDTALSVASRSRIRRAAGAGQPIPEGWATDRQGRPTTDAAAALDGLLQPLAGAKGYGLALVVDLFAGLLSGAAMLSDIADPERDPARPQDLGQMLLVIDTARLMPRDGLDGRMDHFAALIADTPAADPAHPVRLPGARALAALARARSHGLSLPRPLHDGLVAAATDAPAAQHD